MVLENDCQSVKERGCCYGGQERRAANVVVVGGERKKTTRRNKLLGDGRSTREGHPSCLLRQQGPEHLALFAPHQTVSDVVQLVLGASSLTAVNIVRCCGLFRDEQCSFQVPMSSVGGDYHAGLLARTVGKYPSSSRSTSY